MAVRRNENDSTAELLAYLIARLYATGARHLANVGRERWYPVTVVVSTLGWFSETHTHRYSDLVMMADSYNRSDKSKSLKLCNLTIERTQENEVYFSSSIEYRVKKPSIESKNSSIESNKKVQQSLQTSALAYAFTSSQFSFHARHFCLLQVPA